MVEPIVIPRSEHAISRRSIDPDALKVLYRLRQFNHVAYLVGGSVRDLLLGRRPKDFDIGTSAHPYQVKKLFRNCWIIGRRFRLAHVKFGPKVIEVATFRRQLPPEPADGVVEDGAAVPAEAVAPEPIPNGAPIPGTRDGRSDHRLVAHHRDNTFGTPQEDAFRRDFTVNALFYDIATFSIIDYVGGLRDLEARLIRCIGDPDERFVEDPVRMLRAIVMAARLDFHIDPPIYEAIARHRAEIARSAPARLIEEYYKILRSGAAECAFRGLAEAGLLEHISPELQDPPEALWRALGTLDAYRRRFESPPESLTNPILLGTLLVPLGLLERQSRTRERHEPDEAPGRISLGRLPVARRDVDRLRQMLILQQRLDDLTTPPRARRSLLQRPVLPETITWMEIHGQASEAVAYWHAALQSASAGMAGDEAGRHSRRRRRRRRRRFRSPAGQI